MGFETAGAALGFAAAVGEPSVMVIPKRSARSLTLVPVSVASCFSCCSVADCTASFMLCFSSNELK